MLRALLARGLTRFERNFHYDATYMREILAVSPWAFLKFSLVGSLGHGRRAPPGAVAAAGVVGALTEDCGPCTQLGVDMARRGGVPAETLRGILAGDAAAMGEAAALGWRFARAVLARDMEAAEPLRDEILRRWGQGALVDIAMALTTARMYPTLKYALGHGKACSRVTVE
ncbi:MAG: hypothetical protein ACR2F8_04370, partial [Caulobacteraceae bacterium]